MSEDFLKCQNGRMEIVLVKIRTSEEEAERVRAAWRSEGRRLRRLVEDRMRRLLKAEGWPTGPDAAEGPPLPPAEVRRRRRLRREAAAEVKAGGVRPTAAALVTAALEAELEARGWLAGPVPEVDRETVPVSRWPGTGTGTRGAAWRGIVNAQVPAHLPRRTVARCWEHSARAVSALIAWRDDHPVLRRRRRAARRRARRLYSCTCLA